MASSACSSAPVGLVTGSAHRLGKALAEGFARAGYRLALHYHSSSRKAEEALSELSAISSGHSAHQADLSSAREARRLVEETVARHGRLDLLVHSASPWLEGPVGSVRPEDWDQVFAVGPRAGFFLAQAAAPSLSEQAGSILFISDVAATQAWPLHAPHAVAKAAVNALVLNLAAALAPTVRVNGVAPGIVLPPPEMPPESVEKLVKRTPLQRLVRLEDVVAMAVSLVTNPSVTGQVVSVDAGRGVV